MLKLKLQYLATWCEERTHLKRLIWCWERLKAGGEGDDRGWDGWMASPTQWTWVWVSSRSWWWTGKPGILQSMRFQSHTWLSDWTELDWGTSHLLCTLFLLLLHQLHLRSSSIRSQRLGTPAPYQPSPWMRLSLKVLLGWGQVSRGGLIAGSTLGSTEEGLGKVSQHLSTVGRRELE